jgi:hypothetical protein
LVNIDLGLLKKASIKVYTAEGQLAYQEDNINTQVHQFQLNVTKGLYIIELSSQGKLKQYKLLIGE